MEVFNKMSTLEISILSFITGMVIMATIAVFAKLKIDIAHSNQIKEIVKMISRNEERLDKLEVDDLTKTEREELNNYIKKFNNE
jgi:hypothetical protein